MAEHSGVYRVSNNQTQLNFSSIFSMAGIDLSAWILTVPSTAPTNCGDRPGSTERYGVSRPW
ncbi:MAG: hypothetical protein AAF716_16455 [Cyanobacteria bacterium P01_D01_bin.1]